MLEQYILSIFVTASLLLLTIIIYYKFYKFTYWKRRGVDQLNPVILFGDTLDLYLGRCSFGELFKNWYEEFQKRGAKHGGAYFFGKPVYIPVDPEIIKKILISDSIDFPNHALYIDERKNPADPLSKHIFNMENYKWRTLRSKLPVAFTTTKMKAAVATMVNTAEGLIEVLKEFEKDKVPVDVKDVLSCFTIDIISQFALGIKSDTLKGKSKDLKRLSRVFFENQWSNLKNTIVVLIPRHILTFFNFRLFTKEATKFFMGLFEDIKNYRSKEDFKRGDLTDILLKLGNKEDQLLKTDFVGKKQMDPLTFEEIAAQMYVFFEAGFETSSSTQTFALYELAINQDIQQKLRHEIETVTAKHDGKISYESVSEMKYLDRLVDETLRIYPIFPILPRANQRDYKVPGTDLILEKNTFVMVTNMGVQRNPNYWPNPLKFDPHRFTTENKSKRPHTAYLPFGEGPRICIGKRFGLWQTRIGIATVIKNFKITLNGKSKLPFRFASESMILRMDGGVWLDLERI